MQSSIMRRLEAAVLHRCGVMVGITSTEYGHLAAQATGRPYTPFSASGHLTLSVAAGRVSYTFGMQGPSFPGAYEGTAPAPNHAL
jgi:acyl transferase domain-containing protein